LSFFWKKVPIQILLEEGADPNAQYQLGGVEIRENGSIS
jgi:hypothetical protein